MRFFLLQSNSFMEGVSHKIRRQIEELERASGVMSSGLTVDGVPVDSYLTRFVCFVCREFVICNLLLCGDDVYGFKLRSTTAIVAATSWF